jgi:dTDP-4-dehydrorhamnose reductase
LLQAENKDAIIVRTSWLYGGGKQFGNFVNTMLKLADTKKEIDVVDNQFGSPTYTKDLSSAILDIIGDIKKHR